jgi:hypothetical protein
MCRFFVALGALSVAIFALLRCSRMEEELKYQLLLQANYRKESDAKKDK